MTKDKFTVTFGLKDVAEFETFMEAIISLDEKNEKTLPYSYYKFNKAGRKQYDESFPTVTDEKELKRLSKLYLKKK